MGQLEDMAMFIRIVEAGGISKAAEQADIAKSAVSRRLHDLEKRLATQLISRTTRTSSLTDAGQQYYQRAKSIVEDVATLDEDTRGDVAALNGTLKISAPLSFGLLHLADVIDEFACNYPQLDFQLDFSDRHVDLVSEGYEMAIRIGQLPDSSLQARKLTTVNHMLCATPQYLAKHGIPQTPQALTEHAFLQYGLASQYQLNCRAADGKNHKVELQSRIRADNGDFLLDMTLRHHGICFAPTFIAYQHIARGELVSVLDDYQLPTLHAYAVYPQNRFLSQRCRLLIDFLAQRFGDSPYWDNEIC